jgi:hypothetical protein
MPNTKKPGGGRAAAWRGPGAAVRDNTGGTPARCATDSNTGHPGVSRIIPPLPFGPMADFYRAKADASPIAGAGWRKPETCSRQPVDLVAENGSL